MSVINLTILFVGIKYISFCSLEVPILSYTFWYNVYIRYFTLFTLYILHSFSKQAYNAKEKYYQHKFMLINM